MKKVIIVILLLILAAGAGGGAFYQFIYKDPGTVSAASGLDVVYVDSVSMLTGIGGGSGLLQRFAGVVEPQQTWSAKKESDREVSETFVSEGDMVHTGDKLFSYDTMTDANQLEQLEIDLEAKYNDIESNERNIEQLEREKNSANADDQLSITTQIMAAQNQIKQDEYDIKTKELERKKYETNMENSIVYSKIDGIVKSINSENSSSSSGITSGTSSNSDAYITIMEVGSLRVKGTVNEQNLNNLMVGEEMICYSRVDNQLFWKGSISEIDTDNGKQNSSDSYFGSSSDSSTNSTNYSFYVDLENSEGLILGQHVYIEADVGQSEQKDGIWLDTYYFVQEEDGSYYIWAASERGLLEKRAVEIGETDAEAGTYQVLNGLSAEDYITAPMDTLQEGSPVIRNDYGNSGQDYGPDEIALDENFFDDADSMMSGEDGMMSGMDEMDPNVYMNMDLSDDSGGMF